MDQSNAEAKQEEGARLAKDLPPPRLRVTRFVLMAILVLLVGLLTVSTWYFAYSSPRLAVIRLTESLRKEILDSTVEFLDEVFRWNAYAARSLAGMLEKDLLGDGTSLESFTKIRAASFSLFKAIPLVTSIGATSVNGLTGLYVRGGLNPTDRDTGKTAPIYIYSKSSEPLPTFYIENVNMITGDPVGVPFEYHFREHFKDRKWFATALSVPLGEVSWHLALSQTSGRPYLQCGIPILTKKSKEVTVVHCSHSADAITKYLTATLDLKGGNVFVVNDVGDIVFTSEGEHCRSSNISESRGCEHQSEVVNALRFIESLMQVTQLVREEIHFTDVLLGGGRHFLDSWPHSFQGMNLAVVVIIPRNTFWGPMDYHTRIAWIAILLLALGISFVGCFLIFLLMEQVAAEMKLRAELQRQLEAKQRAEASRDAKTAFLSHMSHELRTPMACIIGLLDILMGELKMSEHQSSVRQVHRCATSLVALLNSALDIAKVEAGKLELEVAEFDLETELTSLVEVFSVQCDAKGLHLALQLTDDIPKIMNGDSGRVMQIFTNLIGNSIKFTPKGRVIVRGWVESESPDCTSTRKSGRNQVVMKFEVDDTGPGIGKALRERVFENFVQGAVSVPRTHGGTGLGLGIVRSLVHLMGGDIKIGDKAGDGTVFQFSLSFGLPSDQKSSKYDVMKRREIILGMPEKDCRSVVAEWLEHRGLTVHQVSSWEDATLQNYFRGHFQNGRKMDEKAPLIYEDASGGKPKVTENALASHSGFSRRTRSDTMLKKPVLILDVDLLPRHSNERDYLMMFEKLGLSSIDSEQRAQEIFKSNKHLTQFCKAAKVHAVVWVTASNTPDSLKDVLASLSRSTSRSLVVRRPLHPACLRDLFSELKSRERNFHSEARVSQNQRPLTCAPGKIGNQLGVELYTSDDALAFDKSDSVEGPSREVQESPVFEQKPWSEKTTSTTTSVLPTETEKLEHQMPRYPLTRSHSDDTQKYIGKSELLLASKPLESLDVLVAEDHAVLRMLASTLLRKLGATPFLACNGKEAVNAVISRFQSGTPPFNCILMDCQMPVMDGYNACKAVRQFERDKDQRTCIIALTANAMASDEKQCFLVGMDAFLTKPIEQERLVQVMLSTLNSRSNTQSLKPNTASDFAVT